MKEKEEEILLILGQFEEELSEKIEELKSEIERVKYYEKMQIRGIDFEGIFVTQEKDVDGNITNNIYLKNASKKIISINSKGEIIINPEIEESLLEVGVDLEGLSVEEISKQNDKDPKKLRGISEKLKPADVLEQKEQMQQIQKEEGKQEELDISYYREIEDKNLDKDMKDDLSRYEEKGLAYDETEDAYVLVGKKDGKLEKIDGYEKSQMTMKTVISIDEKGEKIEKKSPHALIKSNKPGKEISITKGQYGYIEAGTVDVLPCNKRVEMQLQERGETIKGRRDYSLERAKQQGGPVAMHNWVHEHEEEIKEMDKGEEKTEDVTEWC